MGVIHFVSHGKAPDGVTSRVGYSIFSLPNNSTED